MSNKNETFTGIVGRKPHSISKSDNEVGSRLEDFVRDRGICTTGEVIKEGMEHFRLSRSQIYKIWSKVKKDKVLRATDEDLRRYKISTVKGNTTYWIHVDNSKIHDEFRELILTLTKSDTEYQFLGLLGELDSKRFHVYLEGAPIEETDLLVCLLALMLNRDCPEEISQKNGMTRLRIDTSEINGFAHTISGFLKTVYVANNYVGKKYEDLFFPILEDTLDKVVIEDHTNQSFLELAKHLSFILNDTDKKKFDGLIFSSFKRNLIKNSGHYDKIYGGLLNIEGILTYLTKGSSQKKLEYRFWKYMWEIVIGSLDNIPEEMISQEEKVKVSDTMHSIMDGKISQRPTLYHDIQSTIERIRSLCEWK